MATILIENGSIVTVNDRQEVLSPGYVFIEDDLIVAVGAGEAPAPYRKADIVLDASLMAVMPGLVNGHTHFFQAFIRVAAAASLPSRYSIRARSSDKSGYSPRESACSPACRD